MNNIVKLIIIGALIVAIPVTVKLVQQQQILKSKAAGNGIPVSDNPPNAKRPCDNAYTWKVLPPGTNGAPALDATRFGMGNDGQGNGCSQHSDCPKNTSDPQNVDQNTSNWCYEFGVGNRCIQLQHIPGQTCAGGGGGGGGGSGTCSISGQSPDIGATCAACLSSKTSPTNVSQVITNIKNMNPNDFNACSNQKILNNWCNGFGAEAARQCNELKTGVCAISCGGSLPNPTPGSNDSKGWLDPGATCDVIKGWTCDGDNNYSNSLQVDFYADGPAGQGVKLGNATASLTREAAVGAQCGGNANHGFSFTVPANSLRDGKPHNIYAYGINAGSGGANQLLQGAPQSVTCTVSTPVRRDLCVSTAVSSGTVPAGGQLTITSTSNEANLRNFRYAFYNRDNGSPPKIICQQGITSVADAAETARQCPNGGAPLVIDKPAAASATSLPTTFSSADLSKPDTNWNNQIPTHFQVNGYFIDQFGLSSTANTNCSKPFDIAASASSPSPTPPAPSNRMPGDADDNRCVNIADYNIWKQERQTQAAKCADWTGGGSGGNLPDGASDASDFGIWYRDFQIDAKRDGCIVPTPNTCLNQR